MLTVTQEVTTPMFSLSQHTECVPLLCVCPHLAFLVIDNE